MLMFSYSNTLHEFSESEKGNYKKRGYKYRTLVFSHKARGIHKGDGEQIFTPKGGNMFTKAVKNQNHKHNQNLKSEA